MKHGVGISCGQQVFELDYFTIIILFCFMPLRVTSGQTSESPCVFNMKRLLKRFILSEMSGETELFFTIGR